MRRPNNHNVRTSLQHTAKHLAASIACTARQLNAIRDALKTHFPCLHLLHLDYHITSHISLTSLSAPSPPRVALCIQVQQQLCNGSSNSFCASMSHTPLSPLATNATKRAAACWRISAGPPTSNTQ